MEKGHNSDIEFKGQQFHIQTEDWGTGNPYFVSRVFQNGAVIKSMKISYNEILPLTLFNDRQAKQLALRLQHEKILDLLVSGQLL